MGESETQWAVTQTCDRQTVTSVVRQWVCVQSDLDYLMCVFSVTCSTCCVQCDLLCVFSLTRSTWCVLSVTCSSCCVFSVICSTWCVFSLTCPTWCVYGETSGSSLYLVCAGLLQSVHHGLKLQRFDLHLSVQSVKQCLILWVHVIVWLLQVQT